MITSKAWWKAAGIRALRTFAQALVAGAAAIGGISAATDWIGLAWTIGIVLINAAGAAILSLLQSLGGLPEVDAEA